MLKCSDKGGIFVDKVLNVNIDIVKKWWKHDYGFFTNGDQDAMVYLYMTS
jgi:hypothetical protein